MLKAHEDTTKRQKMFLDRLSVSFLSYKCLKKWPISLQPELVSVRRCECTAEYEQKVKDKDEDFLRRSQGLSWNYKRSELWPGATWFLWLPLKHSIWFRAMFFDYSYIQSWNDGFIVLKTLSGFKTDLI